MDIRSFFKKPGGANAAAKAEGGAAAQAATPKAEPAALPAAAAASPAATAAAASARKRQLAEEPREVVDLTSEGEEVAPADKRARVAAVPPVDGKRTFTPEAAPQPPAKKPTPAAKKTPVAKKVLYPRPPLRDESELEFSVLADAKWGGADRQAAAPPPSLADLPRGPDDCLEGLTFVLTGALPHLGREDAENLIKRHGGRITQAVSSKTSFLLVGIDSGPSKYGKAKELKAPLIDETGLLALISACGEAPPKPPPAIARAVSAPPLPARGEPGGAAARPLPADADQLWVEKHKPTSVAQLIGNGKLIADLRVWLGQWHRLQAETAGAKAKDAPKKAVLISGPPGIGKTSSAKIICAALGYEVMEVNASDTRGKAEKDVKHGLNGKCSNVVKEMVTNTAVNFDGQAKRQVLIMDEVDGMSGGDRGGVADLIQSMKTSKVPIICICNDAWSQKLRTLKGHCLELVYARPTKQQIRGRMVAIATKEGLNVSETAMDALIENCHSDIRLILNTLQMRRLNSDSLSFDDVKGAMTKDLELGTFNVVDKLLSPDRQMTINERLNLSFQDADIIPLFLQENYVNMRPHSAKNDLHRLELVADASDSISEGDMLNTCVRRHQRWTLMPYAMTLSCVRPASIMRGRREALGVFQGERNFTRFPAWLGKNSSAGKQRRLLGELHSHAQVSGSCFANRSSIREEYMPAMRLALTAPMWPIASGGMDREGIHVVMKLMDSYCLTKDDYIALLDMTRIKAEGIAQQLRDPESLIASATKSAFTRACNDKGRDVKSGIMLPEFKKGRKKKSAVKEGEGEDEEMAEAEEEEEDEAEEPDAKRLASLAAMAKRGLTVQTTGGKVFAGKAKKASAAKAKPKAVSKAKPKK